MPTMAAMTTPTQPGDSFTYYEARRNHDLTEGRGPMVPMRTTLDENAAYQTCRGWGVQGRGDGEVLRVTISADEHGNVTTARERIYGDIHDAKGRWIASGWLDGRTAATA